jgi:hypothetical protein
MTMTDEAEREIEEHVRNEVRTFEPAAGSPEWATQVENLVDEVVAEVAPKTPHQQSVLSELIRSVAQDETDVAE